MKFYDDSINVEYEIEIYQNSGTIRKSHMEIKNALGSSKIVFSSLVIQKIIKKNIRKLFSRK